jgi:hypothetical protein
MALVTVKETWNGTWQGKSRVLLVKGDEVRFDYVWKEQADGEKVAQDTKVKLMVPDKSRYTLAFHGPSGAQAGRSIEVTLNDLLAPARNLSLVVETGGTDDAKANVLTATATNGLVIAQQALPGARAFALAQREPGRDAARLQFLLSQIPADPKDPSAGPCYKDKATEKRKAAAAKAARPKKGEPPPPPPVPIPTPVVVDGKWTQEWAAALHTFTKAYAPALAKKPELIQALADQYAAWSARGWK